VGSAAGAARVGHGILSAVGASFGATTIETFVIALAFGFAGYYVAERFRRARGTGPWRLSPTLWGLICSLFTLLGVMVLLLAELTTRRQLPYAPPDRLRGTYPIPGPRGYGAPGTFAGPAFPFPPPGASPPSPFLDPSGYPAPPSTDGRPALFGWYPDPAGRHQLRYWDGRRWSEHVADDGAASTDPLGPPPMPPVASPPPPFVIPAPGAPPTTSGRPEPPSL